MGDDVLGAGLNLCPRLPGQELTVGGRVLIQIRGAGVQRVTCPEQRGLHRAQMRQRVWLCAFGTLLLQMMRQ